VGGRGWVRLDRFEVISFLCEISDYICTTTHRPSTDHAPITQRRIYGQDGAKAQHQRYKLNVVFFTSIDDHKM